MAGLGHAPVASRDRGGRWFNDARNAAFFKLALASPYADDSWHQLRLWFLNRLQEEPREAGRGAAFLLRLFWPLGYEVVAALP
jgi:hypothetical protein